MTDQQALHLYASRRDAEAFRQLVAMYQQMVYAAALRRLGNREDAADATQQAFIRLAKHAKTIRGDVGAWLHRTVVNAATDLIRNAAARRERERQYALAKPTEAWPDDVPWEPISAVIDEAIAELDDEHRELIVQHFLRGRPQTELAAERDMNQSTVSRRMSAAVEALREKLTSRGVTAPAITVLATGLAASTASASVPAALTAELTKVGLLGGGVAAGVGAGTAVKVAIALICVAGLAAVTVPVVLPTTAAPAPAAPVGPRAIYGTWFAIETFDGREDFHPGHLWELTLGPNEYRHAMGEMSETVPVRWEPDGDGGVLHAATDIGDVAARYALDGGGRLHLAFYSDPDRRGVAPRTVQPAEGVDLTIYSRDRDDWQPPRLEAARATDRSAVEQLLDQYRLAPGEDVRLIRPPYPPTREEVVRTLPQWGEGSEHFWGVIFLYVEQQNGAAELRPAAVRRRLDRTDDLEQVLLRDRGGLTPLQWYEVDGLDRVDWSPGEADWVFRLGSIDRMADQLSLIAALISRETGVPVHFVPRQEHRPMIVLKSPLRPVTQTLLPKVVVLANGEGKPRGREYEGLSQLELWLDAPVKYEPPGLDRFDRRSDYRFASVGPNLDHTAPGYLEKLAQFVLQLRQETGGDWVVEEREVTVWDLMRD